MTSWILILHNVMERIVSRNVDLDPNIHFMELPFFKNKTKTKP